MTACVPCPPPQVPRRCRARENATLQLSLGRENALVVAPAPRGPSHRACRPKSTQHSFHRNGRAKRKGTAQAGARQIRCACQPQRSVRTHSPPSRIVATAPAAGTRVVQSTTDLAITALRVGTCTLMVHHGIDKLERADGFSADVVAKSFGSLPGAPKLWTYAAAAAQILGSGFLGIGLFSRPAALSMSGTVVAAIAFHLRNTGPEGFPLGSPPQRKYNYELAAMYALVLLYFTAAGAGPLSVDEKMLGGELAFYKGLWATITGRRRRRRRAPCSLAPNRWSKNSLMCEK